LVISLEKLLFLKCLAIKIPKYERDVKMIVSKLIEMQYGGMKWHEYFNETFKDEQRVEKI
jgi:hypothetical protein